jgi:hypothetical protein
MGVPGLMAFSPKFLRAAARTVEDAVELGGGIGAVVPEVVDGAGGAEGAGVFVGDEDHAGLVGVGEDLVERGGSSTGLPLGGRTRGSRS